MESMHFGIEQEIPLIRLREDAFADFSNTTHEELQAVVDELPLYPEDYPRLRVGDLGIKQKRWYVEGYERFDTSGKFLKSIPKSLEIRTTPHESIDGALNELVQSYRLLAGRLAAHGLGPAWISFNPIHPVFNPVPPLNSFEKKMRLESPEAETAVIAQLTFGPDLSLSFPDFDDRRLIDAGKKLTYYSPFLLPFSYSSPFSDNALWDGLSKRTFVRTGVRPAVMVFLYDGKNMVASRPSLTQASRVPFEAGRIEFKAFDTCRDVRLYKALFLLLWGLILDETLEGRAMVPDRNLHQHSARAGFNDPEIKKEAQKVLLAAQQALQGIQDPAPLGMLETMLDANRTPVHDLVRTYQSTHSVLETLKQYGNLAL